MEVVSKFKSIDGKLFDSEEACIAHEKMIDQIKQAMSSLKPVPTDCDFGNGEGFVQQDISTVCDAMVKIAGIANLSNPEFEKDPFSYRYGMIGRCIDDSGNEFLSRAWCRFACIDNDGREWGQPYYALNPSSGQQIELQTA